jgi:16S rRNA (guanine966-N2)-methyltransferase
LADVREARVLDLYAGSGALGLEALSRGAESAVFVEASRPAQRAIQDNIAALGVAERASVLPLRAEVSLNALRRYAPFSLVFADPPWADAQPAFAVLVRLVGASLLGPAARLVLEHAARGAPEIPESSPLRPVDTRRWGDTAVTIFEPVSGPAGGS